ncbi:MAG: sulfotransferase [Acidobacteria bacterium]|nr:sulfotransferase [Acidobacteriota bacterium]
MSKPFLPNFFIVGAPKAGSTSLYYYLDQHPQIYMSPIKEPCFFATEIKPDKFSDAFREPVKKDLRALQDYLDGPMSDRRFGGLVLEREQYLKLFRNVRDERAIGEASVCYLWSAEAARNIREEIPAAKIIMILRDPADRAFSQYLHAVTNGLFDGSIREMLQASLATGGNKFGVLYPFLELGMYYRQVKRYQGLYPAESLKICFFEDYQRHQESFVKDIFRFLQVDPGFSPDFSKKHLQPHVARFRALSRFLKRYRLG